MSLSCDFDGGGDAAWYYKEPSDYTVLCASRRKRCCSCNALVNVGGVALKFTRFRYPAGDIEESIYCDEVPLAPWWMCESCADQYFNLEALGFCFSLAENMHDLRREYIELYQHDKPRAAP